MKSLYQFYRSEQWETFRQVVINDRTQEDGFVYDEVTGKPIVKAYDIILHHIMPLTEENYMDYSISLNPENIQIVSHKTHNQLHNKLGYSQRQVFIVYGSPLSGKTSYVYEVMEEGDLIVDMDSIWQCVSGCDRYIKPPRLKSIVFGIRDKLLDDIKIRRGKWSNAYVIGGYPYQMERQRLADTLGAREIYIDTDKATCIERLMNCEDRNQSEWMRYIDDWWLQYSGGF